MRLQLKPKRENSTAQKKEFKKNGDFKSKGANAKTGFKRPFNKDARNGASDKGFKSFKGAEAKTGFKRPFNNDMNKGAPQKGLNSFKSADAKTGFKKPFNKDLKSGATDKGFKPFKGADAKTGFKKPFNKDVQNDSQDKDLNASKPKFEDKKEKIAKDQKELKIERRMKKLGDNYGIVGDMKKIWETLRRAETTEEVRRKLCSTLHTQLKGKIKNMVHAHDTVRVMECLMQYGNESEKLCVFEELKDEVVTLSQSIYSRFLVRKILEYGTKEQREYIANKFFGHIPKLIKHSYACKIIESIYNEYANFQQRTRMLMEFYDSSQSIFNDKTVKTLKAVLESKPQSKEAILENLKTILLACIQKTILMFSLVHRLFLEFFENCDAKSKTEMIEALSEQIVHIVHTKDGGKVAMQCVWFSNAKQRKKIIKALKSFIVKMACEEHGCFALIAVLDSVDDTKFVCKAVLDELFKSIDTVFENENGRKVLTYLISPRDKRFFIADYIKLLESGDTSETSKKEPEKRQAELRDYSIKFFHDYLNKNITKVVTNGAIGILVPEIIVNDLKNYQEILVKLADFILEKEYDEAEHPIENPTFHYVFKKILDDDKKFTENGLKTLSEMLLTHDNAYTIKSWCKCNRGCFSIVKMIEVCEANKQKDVKKLLSDKVLLTQLQSEKFAGAKILLTKLEQINSK